MSAEECRVESQRRRKQLLDHLPDDERKRLMSRAKIVSLTRGQVLFEQGGPMRHIYFPIQSVCGIVLLAGEG
jgi:CRP-like cAMP-binding protein